MLKNRIGAALRAAAIVAAAVLFTACAGEGFDAGGNPQPEDPTYTRPTPTVRMSGYAGEVERSFGVGEHTGTLDLTNISKGYVALRAHSPRTVKVRIFKDDEKYQLDVIHNDGTTDIIPLSMGNGTYRFEILYHAPEVTATSYYAMGDETFDVTLEDEFAPFLVPNFYANYTPDSEAVQFSFELLQHCKTDLEVVAAVYDWITKNITYDSTKAENVNNVPLVMPDPNETLRLKTGICSDYAALAATMLRANGIPTQLIVGNVKNGDDGTLAHAWNNIWLEGGGMLTVKIEVVANAWFRIDTTFGASQAADIGRFIGDGENYYEKYVF